MPFFREGECIMAIKEYNLNIAEEIASDTFRLDYTVNENSDDTFDLYFGKFVQVQEADEKEKEKAVEVKAKIKIPINLALLLASGIFSLCVEYQKTMKNDIGIPKSIIDKYKGEEEK